MVLRTARFFPENDDTDREFEAQNLMANEFLHRRLSVEDAVRAHLSDAAVGEIVPSRGKTKRCASLP